MEIYIGDALEIIAFRVKEFIIGFLVRCMMDFSMKDSKMVTESISSATGIYTKEHTNLTKDREKEYIDGNKEQFTKVNFPMIKSILFLI